MSEGDSTPGGRVAIVEETKKVPVGMRLQVTLSVAFVVLVVPIVATLMTLTYRSNVQVLTQHLDSLIQRAKGETFSNTSDFLEPIADSVRTAARMASIDPNFYRKEESHRYFISGIQNNEDALSYYVGFADGTFRQLLRVSPGDTIFEQAAPPNTRYASRLIDRSPNAPKIKSGEKSSAAPAAPATKGAKAAEAPAVSEAKAVDSYVFYTEDDQIVGKRSAPASYDPRTRGFYKEAEKRGPEADPNIVFVSDPYMILSSRQLGISVSSSIVDQGKIIGAIAANVTMKRLSSYLDSKRVSPNSIMIIADRSGAVVAYPQPEKAIRQVGTQPPVPRKLVELEDPIVVKAVGERAKQGKDSFQFIDEETGKDYVALFSPFPDSFQKPWEVIIIAPMDDFVGQLKENNRKVLLTGLAVLLVAIVLIYGISVYLSKPLVHLVREIEKIRDLTLGSSINLRSNVLEISRLIDATVLLQRSVSAFTAYVPRALVQQLLNAGMPIEPGGQSRYLTIFFTDLAGFSSLSEVTPVRELLERVSTYLDLVSQSVHKESGTVDKFIGDSVMAFWGAPLFTEDHAYRACVAAVRSQRRMDVMNKKWVAEGAVPLGVRIGIHCDSVLVGNVGSIERLSYTVMGDGVNVASRLEGINKEFGTRICVSHAVFREAGERLWLRPIDEVTVKGRRESLQIYELLGIRGEDEETAPTERERELCVQTEAAYRLYAAGQWAEAAAAYGEIATRYDDALAVTMRERCREKQAGWRV